MSSSPSVVDFGPAPHRFRDARKEDAWTKRFEWLVSGWRPDDAMLDQYRAAHFKGDPAADALVDWMQQSGMRASMALFEQALDHGIDSVAHPPEPLRRFFDEVDLVPTWLSRRTLRRACGVAERAALGHSYVLFSVSLLAGYVSSGITKTLVATGELERMAPRRIAETSKFVDDVYQSQTLERLGDGFKSTIRVRIMHAFVRRKLLRSGWDVERWGVPINQADMAGTVLSFSISYLTGLRMLGFVITRRERHALIHLWRYVGRLLGVDDALLAATESESKRLLWLSAATQEGPDQDGVALGRALLTVPSAYAGTERAGQLLAAFDTQFSAGLTRFFLGKDVADRMGLPDTMWKYAVFAITPLNFAAEVLGRVVPFVTRASSRTGKAMNAYKLRMLTGSRPVRFAPRDTAAPREPASLHRAS